MVERKGGEGVSWGGGGGGRRHKALTYVEYRAVSGVFQNITPHPPTCRAVRGVGSIFWKTPDIGLASFSTRIISLRMEGSITISGPSHSGEPTIQLHNTLTSVLPYRLLNDFISLLREIAGNASYSVLVFLTVFTFSCRILFIFK
jgi:hypothetical protein